MSAAWYLGTGLVVSCTALLLAVAARQVFRIRNNIFKETNR